MSYVAGGGGEQVNADVVLMENMKERDLLKDMGVDRRIILRFILNKMGGCGWHLRMWLRLESSGRFL
jgi:hypothetical protein